VKNVEKLKEWGCNKSGSFMEKIREKRGRTWGKSIENIMEKPRRGGVEHP